VLPLDASLFPDPFAPLTPVELPPDAPQCSSLHRQRLRRAEILAATRRQLAESGAERLTLKRIADECDVAVQTLRNSFGRREDLIVSAVNEHTSSIWQKLGIVSPGPAAFIDFSQMIYECATRAPSFLRGTLAIAFSNNPALRVLQDHAAGNKTRLLRKMASQGMLRPEIDIDLLAAQITKLDTMLMYDWAQNGKADELIRQLVAGHKVLLLGTLRDSAAAHLEH